MYDFVFITHLPSFYKTNLYKELAKEFNICVIFVGSISNIRTSDFVDKNFSFDYHVINDEPFEARSRLRSLIKSYRYLRHLKYKLLVVGGWDLPEFWLSVLLSRKKNNCIVIESSIHDSQVNGLKGGVKRLFLSRCSFAFASGRPHQRLLECLRYSGSTLLTKGVGLFNRMILSVEHTQKSFTGKFLYLGRLSPEKNLDLVIEYFAKNADYHLSIAGDGPLRDELQNKAPSNIEFLGHVPNEQLYDVFSSHDVLLLPSLSETWGLVIEESLYFGLPVICSDRVGAAEDMVKGLEAGCVFSPTDISSLDNAVKHMSDHYTDYCLKVSQVDFAALKDEQLSAYRQAINAIK